MYLSIDLVPDGVGSNDRDGLDDWMQALLLSGAMTLAESTIGPPAPAFRTKKYPEEYIIPGA